MGREGPCFHCGVENTPLWRSGPPEKPVLCNACGSRWRTRGTLEDYVPKHANKDSQNNQSVKLPSVLNPISSSSTDYLEQPLKFGSDVVGHDQSSTILGDGASNGTTTAIAAAFSNNFTQMQNIEEAAQPTLWDCNNVSKKKRSILDQRVISPTERFHQQLCYALQDSDIAKESNDEDVLIFERINHYIPENEIGLGCMLLEPPASPAKNSTPKSSSLVNSPTSPSKRYKPVSSSK